LAVADIDALIAREILDSRGNPTVEVEVLLDDDTVLPSPRARQPVPSRRSSAAMAVTATWAKVCVRQSRPSSK
jgi:enolase